MLKIRQRGLSYCGTIEEHGSQADAGRQHARRHEDVATSGQKLH